MMQLHRKIRHDDAVLRFVMMTSLLAYYSSFLKPFPQERNVSFSQDRNVSASDNLSIEDLTANYINIRYGSYDETDIAFHGDFPVYQGTNLTRRTDTIANFDNSFPHFKHGIDFGLPDINSKTRHDPELLLNRLNNLAIQSRNSIINGISSNRVQFRSDNLNDRNSETVDAPRSSVSLDFNAYIIQANETILAIPNATSSVPSINADDSSPLTPPLSPLNTEVSSSPQRINFETWNEVANHNHSSSDYSTLFSYAISAADTVESDDYVRGVADVASVNNTDAVTFRQAFDVSGQLPDYIQEVSAFAYALFMHRDGKR